jgi:hypothetical protein
MQRRRFLAGAAGGVVAGLLSGCGEGKYARRIAVNTSIDGKNETGTNTPEEGGIVLLDHEFYRQGSSAGVRGRVKNGGNIDLDFIAAYVRFFDRTGTRIGQAYDAESGFPVGEKWQFTVPLLDTEARRVARYTLVVIDQRSTEVEPFQNDTS